MIQHYCLQIKKKRRKETFFCLWLRYSTTNTNKTQQKYQVYRDLGSHFAREIEDIVEKHIPTYSRFQKQRSMEEWAGKLSCNGLFRLEQYSVYRHPLLMPNAGALVDLLNCMSFVRAGLRGEARRRFNNELKSMIERRYGKHRAFAFPLETKMYVLQKDEKK